MEQTIFISLAALIFCIATAGWIFGKQKSRLDRLYHDALHAESIGQYETATALYQSILDRSGFFLIIDNGIRSLIKRRMNTLRNEQDYLSQFNMNGVKNDHANPLIKQIKVQTS